ncbi:hypothetical protein Adt_35374 [Abeliophyllum distichum]|uniref:Uncharacterized protein n=1 Tax=Abeliophyllum distichum TaxID=126358 RepID=A0ABD1QGD0_9LAMI
MVVALGPGKFYGSSLPRPRIYTDVKLSDERVDPPTSVMDPFISWAQEAHWSMGGLSFKRHRLQGRIEGNVNKLRAQREKSFKISQKQNPAVPSHSEKSRNGNTPSPSPPPAPLANKRRRAVGLVDEDEDEDDGAEEEGYGSGREIKRGAVRKLGDDFERVARESGMGGKKASPAKKASVCAEGLASRTRSKQKEVVNDVKAKKGKKLVKGGKSVGAAVVAAAVSGLRSSPRLAARGGLT